MWFLDHDFREMKDLARFVQAALAAEVAAFHAPELEAEAAEARAMASQGWPASREDVEIAFEGLVGGVLGGDPASHLCIDAGGGRWWQADMGDFNKAARVEGGRVTHWLSWSDLDPLPTWSCRFDGGARTCITPQEPGSVEITWLDDHSSILADVPEAAFAWGGFAKHLPPALLELVGSCPSVSLVQASSFTFASLCTDDSFDHPTSGVYADWGRHRKLVRWNDTVLSGWALVRKDARIVRRHWGRYGVRDVPTLQRAMVPWDHRPMIDPWGVLPDLDEVPSPRGTP